MNILRAGFTKTKKYTITDLNRYLYPLSCILEISPAGYITCNRNTFWKPENNKKRIELIYLIRAMRKPIKTDKNYCEIINRFENGDAFGIRKEKNGKTKIQLAARG